MEHNTKKFIELFRRASNIIDTDLNNRVTLALMAAEVNASDTLGEDSYESEEYYSLALGSISNVEEVTDGERKEEVIAWFEKHNHII